MKSHRKHAPNKANEREPILRKGRVTGSVSPDGKKRRLDQLHQAMKNWWMYYEWIEEDKARKAECVAQKHKHRCGCNCGWGGNWFRKSFKQATERLNKLWHESSTDKII